MTINLTQLHEAILNGMMEEITRFASSDYKANFLRIKTDDEIKAIVLNHIRNILKFLNTLNKSFFIRILLLKIITQLSFFKTVSHSTDTNFIDKNLLRQTTYYKTITSRP